MNGYLKTVSVKDSGVAALVRFLRGRSLHYASGRFVVNASIPLSFLLLMGAGAGLLFDRAPYTFFVWMFLGVVISVPVFAVLYFIKCVVTRSGFRETAMRVEQEQGDERQWLLAAIEIAMDRDLYERDLGKAVIKNGVAGLPRYGRSVISGLMHRSALLLLSSMLFAFSNLTPANKVAYWIKPLLFGADGDITLHLSTQTIPQGGSVTLSVIDKLHLLPSLTLYKATAQGRYHRDITLFSDSNGVFSKTFSNIHESMMFYGSSGRIGTNVETLTVVPPPVLSALSVTVTPPRYTGEHPYALPEGEGDVRVPAGSTIELTVESNTILATGQILLRNDSLVLDCNGKKGTGSFTVWNNGEYAVLLSDPLGQKSLSRQRYSITVIADEAPTARIIKPSSSGPLSSTMKEVLFVDLSDDRGIRSATLNFKRVVLGESVVESTGVALSSKAPFQQAEISWDLNPLGLYTGDTVWFWVTVHDNSPRVGGQYGVSDTMFYRLPSIAESHRSIAEKEASANNSMQSAKDLQQKIEKQLKEFVESRFDDTKELTFEEKQVMEEVTQRIQEQADSLSSAVSAMEEAVKKLRENGGAERVAAKMEQVQKELEALLEKMGEKLFADLFKEKETSTVGDLRRDIDKMTQMIPDIEKRLERAIEYLKQLQKESERALLAERAAHLAEDQMRSLDETGDHQRATEKEEALSDAVDELLKDVESALDDPESPVTRENIPALDKASQQQSAMKQKKNAGAQQQKQDKSKMAGALSELASELESTLSSSMAAEAEKDRERIVALAVAMQGMSEWQGRISGLARDEQINENVLAIEQQWLRRSFEGVGPSLDSLKTLPPALVADLYGGIKSGLQLMDNLLGNIPVNRGLSQMRGAQGILNKMTAALLDISEQMSGQGQGDGEGEGEGGGGMSGSLRRLSGRQSGVNSATAQLLSQMLGKGQGNGESKGDGEKSNGTKEGAGSSGQGDNANGSADGNKSGAPTGEALKQVRQAQEEIAEKLKELADQQRQKGNAASAEKVEELERSARQIGSMFASPDQSLQDRQNEFLKNMLSASLSLNRKDDEKDERKGKSASVVFTKQNRVEGYRDFTDKDQFYKMRIDAMKGNFPGEYRQKIDAYMDRLQKRYFNDNDKE